MDRYDDAADFWDAKYANEAYHFGTAPNAFLAAQAHRLQPGWRALAVADGEGRNGVWLAERGLQVDALEISPRAIEKARALAESRGVAGRYAARRADLADCDLDRGTYDLVAAIFIQFAPPEMRADLFRRLQAALAPGGLLLLQGYRPEQVELGTGGPPNPDHMYTERLLRDAFAGLDILQLRAHDDTIAEGRGHDGLSALIDLVARKPA